MIFSTFQMPCGKFKGKNLAEIPDSYLLMMQRFDQLSLQQAASFEMGRRYVLDQLGLLSDSKVAKYLR